MYMECRHIKTNGLRCKSPALKGGHFCYFHSKTHTVAVDEKFGPLVLPAPEDPASIQLSVARINEAVLLGHLDLAKAATLFSGLRIAAQFIDRKSYFDEAGTIPTTEVNAKGEELAPENAGCDDDEDCAKCSFSDRCTRCLRPGDEGYDDIDDEDEDGDDENEDEHEEEEEDNEEDQILNSALRILRKDS